MLYFLWSCLIHKNNLMQTKRILGSVLLFGSLFLVGCGKTASKGADTDATSSGDQVVTYDEEGNVIDDGSGNTTGGEDGSATGNGSGDSGSTDSNGASSATPEQQQQVNDANSEAQSGKSECGNPRSQLSG